MTLSVIFYPYHFVRAILSIAFCPMPFCPYTILSILFCPYHFVRYHFVLEPLLELFVPLANCRIFFRRQKVIIRRKLINLDKLYYQIDFERNSPRKKRCLKLPQNNTFVLAEQHCQP